MKKLTAIILTLAAIFSLSACGSETATNETTPPEATTAAEIPEADLDKLASDILEKATTLDLSFSDPVDVDFSNKAVCGYYTGIEALSDKAVKGIAIRPLIGTVPFSLVLLQAKPSTDKESFKKEIIDALDLANGELVENEKAAVASSGDIIMICMSTAEYVDEVCKVFGEINSDASEPLSKTNK